MAGEVRIETFEQLSRPEISLHKITCKHEKNRNKKATKPSNFL